MFDKLCTKLLTTAKVTITGVTSLFAKLCTCSHAGIGYWLLKANYPGDLQQELLSSSKFSGSWKEKLQRKLSLWVSTHKERKTLLQVGTGSSEMLHARTDYQLNTPSKRRITASWIPVNKKIKSLCSPALGAPLFKSPVNLNKLICWRPITRWMPRW